MIQCLKCGARMADNAVFCGICGNRLQPDATIIDGKKRKHSRRFFHRSGRTKTGSSLFLAGFFLLFLLGLWLLLDTCSQLDGLFAEIGHIFHQLQLKSKYLAEGVPFSYLNNNISALAACFTLLIDLVFSLFLLLFGGYFSAFYGYNLFLHLRYQAFYPYHKPVTLEKVSNIIMAVGSVTVLVFVVLYSVLGLIQWSL